MKKIKIIIVIFFLIYILLLTPGLIVSNIGESSGIVLTSQIVSSQQFPLGIQDFLYQGNITVIIFNDLNSHTKNALVTPGNLQFDEGELIRIKEITTSMSIDSRSFSPFINQTFNRFIIGKPEKAGKILGIINFIPTLPLKNMLISISIFIFYFGGFFLIMGICYYLNNDLKLWTIPGMICCYSFQFFLAGIIADISKIGFDLTFRMFGYFFILLIPFTLYISKYEDTNEGKAKIIELYEINNKIMQSLVNDFKRFLGIHQR